MPFYMRSYVSEVATRDVVCVVQDACRTQFIEQFFYRNAVHLRPVLELARIVWQQVKCICRTADEMTVNIVSFKRIKVFGGHRSKDRAERSHRRRIGFQGVNQTVGVKVSIAGFDALRDFTKLCNRAHQLSRYRPG